MAVILSYDEAAHAAEVTEPGRHIPGAPGPGLFAIWIGWLAVAAFMLGLGGMVFVGILQAVAAQS